MFASNRKTYKPYKRRTVHDPMFSENKPNAIYYRLHLTKKKNSISLKSSNDLPHSLLRDILGRFNTVKENVSFMSEKCTIKSLINQIITLDYFGTPFNRKRFYWVVDRILTQSRYECIHTSRLCENYDIDAIPWLNKETYKNDSDFKKRKNVLIFANMFLLEHVVKRLIRYYYFPLIDCKTYEVKFIPRDEWNKFRDKAIKKLFDEGCITRINKRNRGRVFPPRGYLKIFPKKTLESLKFRPLVVLKDKSKVILERYKKKIDELIRSFTVSKTGDLYNSWRKYVRLTEGKVIYALKIDIYDAFGNVDLDQLSQILAEATNLGPNEKFVLRRRIQQQFIFIDRKKVIHHWHQGLLQGDCLSLRLCNLYLAYKESEELSQFSEPHIFFHRTVDDIFFCSTNINDIFDFEVQANRVYVLNESKTVKVLNCYEAQDCIEYWGHVFNIKSKEVRRLYPSDKRVQLRHRFKLWDIRFPVPECNISIFVERAMRFFTFNMCFSKLTLNTHISSMGRAVLNYFDGMCYVAFKFMTVIDAIIYAVPQETFVQFTLKCINKTVAKMAHKVLKIIKQNAGPKYIDINDTNIFTIGFKAFIVVLHTKFSIYKCVIEQLKEISHRHIDVDNINLQYNQFQKLPVVFQNIVSRKKSVI